MSAFPADGSAIVVTGAAGFIGSHTAEFLLARGDYVVGIDEVNDYYDVKVKEGNIKLLEEKGGDRFTFYRGDICDKELLERIWAAHGKPRRVVHMAARAGVRPSIDDPFVYVHSNVEGTTRLMDVAVKHGNDSFVFASSSSVYGGSKEVLFREADSVDFPVSPYAATKKAPGGAENAPRRSDGRRNRPRLPAPSGLRAPGVHVPPPLQDEHRGAALLHGLRAARPAGHGAPQVRLQDLPGPAHPAVRRRHLVARLHVRRRRRLGHRAGARQAPGLPGVQPGQRQPHEALGLHQARGEGDGRAREDRGAAHAARRRPAHLRGHLQGAGAPGLRPEDALPRGHQKARRVVPRGAPGSRPHARVRGARAHGGAVDGARGAQGGAAGPGAAAHLPRGAAHAARGHPGAQLHHRALGPEQLPAAAVGRLLRRPDEARGAPHDGRPARRAADLGEGGRQAGPRGTGSVHRRRQGPPVAPRHPGARDHLLLAPGGARAAAAARVRHLRAHPRGERGRRRCVIVPPSPPV
mmetsp:Transcript_7564/g.22430  ORF Transcript_7564/g.22430 Transcript_7564/m.22430 type:complete len:522 (-) Transcript_7564:24-1589(-)